jgi:DNA helicase HerA-like ATPase
LRVALGYSAAAAKLGEAKPVIWDYDLLVNGHVLITGKSGTGKTHLLCRMLNQLHRQSNGELRAHVIDVHGDIDVPASTVKFSEGTGFGFNPLEINADHDFGGVRKRIQYFISTLSRSGRMLGSKQEATLRALLNDLYAAAGFYADQPLSWACTGIHKDEPKRQPTLEDAVLFATQKAKALYLGADTNAIGALEQVSKAIRSLRRKQQQLGGMPAHEVEAAMSKIDSLRDEASTAYAKAMETMETGHELDDLMRYDSKDVLKGVMERLENLVAAGVFKSEPPPFDPGMPIWRYDIRALAPDEKKMFVAFLLEKLFTQAVQRGSTTDLREVIVIDEAHLFIDEEPDNAINVIAKEARKFGVGLFCASQSPTHFSEDFLSGVATKVLLGLDELFWDQAVRKMQVEKRALEWVKPQRCFIAQLATKATMRSEFQWIVSKDVLERGMNLAPTSEVERDEARGEGDGPGLDRLDRPAVLTT